MRIRNSALMFNSSFGKIKFNDDLRLCLLLPNSSELEPLVHTVCRKLSPYLLMFKDPRNRFQGIDSAWLGIVSWAPSKVYRFVL
jgi:hypothetical protein